MLVHVPNNIDTKKLKEKNKLYRYCNIDREYRRN